MRQLPDVVECIRDSPDFRIYVNEGERAAGRLESQLDRLSKASETLSNTGDLYLKARQQLSNRLLETAELLEQPAAGGPVSELLRSLTAIGQLERVLIRQLAEQVARTVVHQLRRQLSSLKETRHAFEKATADLDSALNRHAQVPRQRTHDALEAAAAAISARRVFRRAGLDHCHQLARVECDKQRVVTCAVQDYYTTLRTYYGQGWRLCNSVADTATPVASAVEQLEVDCGKLQKLIECRLPEQTDDALEELLLNADLPRRSTVEGRPLVDGYLYKRASNAFRTWSRRWFMLDDRQLTYQRRSGDELTVVEPDLRLCTVRLSCDMERRGCFEVLSPTKSHVMQADSPQGCQMWVEALQQAIGAAFHNQPDQLEETATANTIVCNQNSMAAVLAAGKADSGTMSSRTSNVSGSVVQQLSLLAGNDCCADCGQTQPAWASINIGVTLCIECSGIHRSLGVHVSKVRSLSLDQWEPEVMSAFAELGNSAVNSVYEALRDESARDKPPPTADRASRETYIRAKYVERRYVGELCDGVLDAGGDHGGENLKRWSVQRLRRRRSSNRRYSPSRCANMYNNSEPRADEHTPGEVTNTVLFEGVLSDELPELPDETAAVLDSGVEACSDEDTTASLELTADTLLYRAAAAHNLPIMCQALAFGADVNWRLPKKTDVSQPTEFSSGATPLHAAVDSGSAAACQYLLLNGADGSATDSVGRTPLHRAVAAGHMAQLCVLLKHRVDQHARDASGCDALQLAVSRADADMVTVLRLARLSEQMRHDEEAAGEGDDTFNQVMRDFSMMVASPSSSSLTNQRADE